MGRIQEKMSSQQSEMEELRNLNAQLARQIREQEVKINEELVVVLWAVNRNTNHIRSLHR
jgi:hypothetical protein